MKRMRGEAGEVKVKTGIRAPSRPMLVPMGRCPNVPAPCGHCHYCRVGRLGAMYWTKGIS